MFPGDLELKLDALFEDHGVSSLGGWKGGEWTEGDWVGWWVVKRSREERRGGGSRGTGLRPTTSVTFWNLSSTIRKVSNK